MRAGKHRNKGLFSGRIVLVTVLTLFMASLQSIVCADNTSRIVVSPEYLVLGTVAGRTAALTRTFTIANGGSGTLNYTLSGNISWFSLGTLSGSVATNTAVVTVTVNPSGLAPGGSPYIGDITVTNTDVPQDVKKIRVRLVILTEDAYVHGSEYDVMGHVTRRIMPDGDMIEYVYNAAGLLAEVHYSDGTSVIYGYDAGGNRTSMTDQHGTTTYAYDELHRLRRVGYPKINPVLYDYDRSGKLVKLTYPDQQEVGYAYDADGRLTSIASAAGTATYEYDNTSNKIIKKSLPNGVYTTYAYDQAGRVVTVSNMKSDHSGISTYRYVYDANNNITSEVEVTASATESKTFSYDKLNRLTRVDYSDGTYEAYTYDAMGNRLTMTTAAGLTNYEYDSSNRLIRAGDAAFFYDKNGNCVKKVSAQKTEIFTYDFNNMLVSYSNGTEVVQYQYDGDRNRIARIVNGVTTRYVNDINRDVVQVLVETNVDNAVTRKYIYGKDLISQETF